MVFYNFFKAGSGTRPLLCGQPHFIAGFGAGAARSRGTGIWLEPAPASILPGSFIFYVNYTVGTLH